MSNYDDLAKYSPLAYKKLHPEKEVREGISLQKAQQEQLQKAVDASYRPGPAQTLPPSLTARLETVEKRLALIEQDLHAGLNGLLDELRTLKDIVIG